MKPEDLITKGLQSNFEGSSQYGNLEQSGIIFTTAKFKPVGGQHHDQWIQARTTGGLETTKTQSGTLVRSYAGGTVKQEILEGLEIDEQHVLDFLKEVILNHIEKVRLYSDFDFSKRDFRYSYKVIDRNHEVNLTIGKETIFYKDSIVFVHSFLICNIES